MKKFLIAATILLVATIAQAQTTNQIQWDVPVALTEHNTYTVTVTIDNVLRKEVPSCVANGAALTTCSLVVPALAVGTHNIQIVNAKGNQTAGLVVNGADPSTGPKPPQNFRINITITITSGT